MFKVNAGKLFGALLKNFTARFFTWDKLLLNF